MNDMTAKYENGNVVITIPVELIIQAQGELRPYGGYKINPKDSHAVGEYVAGNVLEFDEQEDGTTRFQQLLDDLFDGAYENAEPWLELIEIDDADSDSSDDDGEE